MGELEGFATSETATDYVRMFVTYTDKNGNLQSGNIVVQLRADVAPITAANFQKLVGEGFYDGLTFHRVYSGFMIQGGDPDGNGSGGSAETIKGEFSSNGVENNLSHTRGIISMARSNDPDSASSQFFIMHADAAASLDGNYAAFGQVIYGMETVDGIANIEVKYNASSVDRVPTTPVNPVTIQKMVFVTPTN
ncbi:MAG: peptidylprolyl isomerase [Clostridia bacterium]|nr:peptidylprolyl isomerase [Clostridia bacterium]